MKVRVEINARCPECNRRLTGFPAVGAADPTVECLTPLCKNKGKVFRVPEIELEEIKPQSQVASGDYRQRARDTWDHE